MVSSLWTRELSIRIWGTDRIVYISLRYYYYLLSPLCRVFTVTCLKQTIFLGNTVLQLFCSYNLCYMLLPTLNILYCYISISRSMCAVPNMAVCCSSFISCFPGVLLIIIIIIIIIIIVIRGMVI
jgi:hypothetical protein